MYFEVHGNDVFYTRLELVVLLYGGDPFRRPGQNEVALLQCDDLAYVTDEKRNGENHLSRAAVLSQLVIHLQPQRHVSRVRDPFFGNELAYGAGGVESFSQCPRQTLGLALFLDVSGCHVQAQRVARNVVHSVSLGDSRAALPNDNTQFNFMVQVAGVPGDQNRGALGNICRRWLQEQNRLCRKSIL